MDVVGLDKALEWAQSLNVSKYRGQTFQGNACRKMLQEADKLLNPVIYQEVGLFRIIPCVTAFKEMNKLVENCFSIRVTDKLILKEQIDKLRKALAAVEVSDTLKLHILMWHIEDCLDSLRENEGLGL